ncbi:hypothetical protein OZX72_03045 [Bifidobacterium sp. ESL0769]|uniref:hypothetical protein n=1 Tax=Bifidobacterium sp. ESL0769 TaxID=2983229 RepID=UPI0023F745CD|nr:hypothetical protein [Bifidobacterium sp. ESL0769]WEV67974.1 hypothetical protein OZX72_03045 [Bifidobacterium sp. ESL0769]
MSENVIIAIVGAGGVVFGGVITSIANMLSNRRETDVKSSQLLLEAQQQLMATMAYNDQLWTYNRELVRHISDGKGPPPPEPPEGLFDHDFN